MTRNACSTHGSDVQYLQNFDRKNLEERDYLKGLGVDRRFTLMWIAENMVKNLKNGSISSRKGQPSGSGHKTADMSYKNHLEFLHFLSDY